MATTSVSKFVKVIPPGLQTNSWKPAEIKVKYYNFKFQTDSWRDVLNIYFLQTENGQKVWKPLSKLTWNINTEWNNVCSEPCGTGSITRKPGTCTRTYLATNEVETIDEYYCIFNYRKDPNYEYKKDCQTSACPSTYYEWVADEWPVECNEMTTSRRVGCFVRYPGSSTVAHQVDDSFCNASTRPSAIRTC